MAELKRDEIKYVRDLSKSSYTKEKECFICGSEEELQFHHFYSMTLLWEKWKKINKVIIDSVDDIMTERENFKGDHVKEIYTDTVTLCKFHHMERLHKLYGKVPSLATAEKQKRWCQREKDKHDGRTTEIEDESPFHRLKHGRKTGFNIRGRGR